MSFAYIVVLHSCMDFVVHRTRAIVEADRSIGRSLWRIAHVNRDAPDLLRSVLRLVERLVTDG